VEFLLYVLVYSMAWYVFVLFFERMGDEFPHFLSSMHECEQSCLFTTGVFFSSAL